MGTAQPSYYDPDQMANIFGFSHVAKRWRVTYDSDKEDAFKVHRPDGPLEFKRTKDGLYAFKSSANFKKKEVAAAKNMSTASECAADGKDFRMSSVQENRKGYTERQFNEAKRARRLYHIVGCPTVENFKYILRQNIIQNLLRPRSDGEYFRILPCSQALESHV